MKNLSFPNTWRSYSVVIVLVLALIAGIKWQSRHVTAQEISSASDRIAQITSSAVFTDFNTWTDQYLNGDAVDVETGEKLAIARRGLLAELITLDPPSALARSVPPDVIDRLPAQVKENLEKRFVGNGDFNVVVYDLLDPATGRISGERIDRRVVINGTSLKVFSSDQKAVMKSAHDVPLTGIALDGVAAIENTAFAITSPQSAS